MKYGILLAGFVLITILSLAWNQNQKMQVPGTNHWVSCGSGFFYETNTYQEGDWYKAELHALDICSNHSKRGTHEPVWFERSNSRGNGILSYNSDSVQVDNLLVVNMELGPENHFSTLQAYGYE